MSLFGQPSGALGAQTASNPAPSFGAQFGVGAPSQPSTGGGLFGAATPGTSFGQSQQPSGGLFGAAAPAASGGSLFGQSTSGGFGASAPALGGGGAFGQSSGGLFGSGGASSAFGTPASTGGSSLFGAGASAARGASGSSFSFGAQPAGAFSFGQPASTPAQGGGLFGQSTGASFPGQVQSQPWAQTPQIAQQQHQLPQQQPQAPPGNTRVSQLPPQAVQVLEATERLLADQRVKAARLLALRPTTEDSILALRERCAATRRRLVRTDTGVESLTANAAALRNAVREDRRAADSISQSLTQLSRSLENESGSTPSSAYPYYGGAMTPVPSIVTHVDPDYFASVVNDLEERANWYKREIDQIAEFLCAESGKAPSSAGLESLHARYSSVRSDEFEQTRSRDHRDPDSGHRVPQESRGRVVEDIIRRQYEFFMVVANNIASVHETLTRLKEDYMASVRRYDPDATDPFEQSDARERAEDERKRRAAAAVQAGGLLNVSGDGTAGPGQLPSSSPTSAPATSGGQVVPATGNFGSTSFGLAGGGFGQTAQSQSVGTGFGVSQAGSGGGLSSTPFSFPIGASQGSAGFGGRR